MILMPKGTSKAELFIAFHMGFSPKQLMAKGYSKSTVYNYHWRYTKRIKPAFERLIK